MTTQCINVTLFCLFSNYHTPKYSIFTISQISKTISLLSHIFYYKRIDTVLRICYYIKALNNCSIVGEVSEWFKELVLKTSDSARGRGFESHPLRHFYKFNCIQLNSNIYFDFGEVLKRSKRRPC